MPTVIVARSTAMLRSYRQSVVLAVGPDGWPSYALAMQWFAGCKRRTADKVVSGADRRKIADGGHGSEQVVIRTCADKQLGIWLSMRDVVPI